MSFRIGHGVDTHRLEPGRSLTLGGVQIPFERGLAGHSDADVVCHALANALLGAIGEGDIGEHFPDTNQRYKGMSSLHLLNIVVKKVGDKGYRIQNADLTLMAEHPKIGPFKDDMRTNLSQALGIGRSAINVKATTGEKMGFVGRGEGMTAEAVVLLEAAAK